jgi:hypothetical protein
MDGDDAGSSLRIDRRTALKATSAGLAGLVGLPAGASAAEQSGDGEDAQTAFPLELLNPRVRSAAHAWKRGYVGRPDRALSLTDSGVDGRHGDVGPWNGVRTINGEEDLELASDHEEYDSVEDVELPDRDELPEMVAWHDTNLKRPRDTNGHGNSVSSIMQGSGRAWSLHPDSFLESFAFDGEGPQTVGTSETVERAFDVPDGVEELFVGVAGNALAVTLLGPDGQELATATVAPPEFREILGNTGSSQIGSGSWDSGRETMSAKTVDSDGQYTLRVESSSPADSVTTPELRQAAVTEVVKEGTDIPEEGGMDSPEDPSVPAGAELSTASGRNVHPGDAPGYSLVAAPGTGTLKPIATHAETYARKFGVRVVNQSWGSPFGVPTAAVQSPIDTVYQDVAKIARAGMISVHAVANQPGLPTGGNDSGSGAPETISCVNVTSLYGINTSSSGGLATVTEDGQVFRTPDVCAIGSNEVSANTPANTGDGEYGVLEEYTSGTGTSYAAPSVSGLSGLVMQAMEEDGPEGLDLPSPEGMYENNDEQDRLEWTLKAKSAVLATASTTAYNALPWHGDQLPIYTPGWRDPYEGFGHINHGAAVDAVSRDLTGAEAPTREELGLYVPDDEQSAAGYITGKGEYTVSVSFEGYEGADAGLTQGDPHVDLFVYDALSPEGVGDDNPETGTPVEVARSLGTDGPDGSVTVSLEADDVYTVVVKLVSVPGDGTERLPEPVVDALPSDASGFLFNGADVRAKLNLDVSTN